MISRFAKTCFGRVAGLGKVWEGQRRVLREFGCARFEGYHLLLLREQHPTTTFRFLLSVWRLTPGLFDQVYYLLFVKKNGWLRGEAVLARSCRWSGGWGPLQVMRLPVLSQARQSSSQPSSRLTPALNQMKPKPISGSTAHGPGAPRAPLFLKTRHIAKSLAMQRGVAPPPLFSAACSAH